jgi:predicted ribonuclease YlaK
LQATRATRKEKRRSNAKNVQPVPQPQKEISLRLVDIKPKTDNQSIAFRAWGSGQHEFLHGLPGTGKSLVALYLALRSVLEEKKHEKVVIVRSSVPTRDIGFMPGSAADKMKHYEAPYAGLCTTLFGRGDAYEILKKKGVIEFMPTSFIRGITVDDAVIIVEEAQNMAYQEIRSVITRLGDNSRFIINGDLEQDDLSSERYKEETGLKKLMDIMKKIPTVTHIEFGIDDIVRSDFIKQFIIAEYGL